MSKIDILKDNSCVVIQGGKEYRYFENGVAPLLKHLHNQTGFIDAQVYDKVIGKAAALLIVYGKGKTVHTKVISKYAKEVFLQNGVEYDAEKEVEYIINRKGDGMCPLEKLCLDITSPQEGYKQIIDFIHSK